MKNFTKQNFKTNPLWIRLLIMTFMLLAGAGNVWGYYVTGWNGNWNPTQYNMGSSNSYTINNVEAGEYEFKITDGSWSKTWGSGCLSSATGTASKIDNGDCGSNAKIKISTKSNVTIKFTCYECYDKGGASIQVSATAVQVDPVTVTGYQLAGFNDWGNPITMTKNGNIYSCTKTLTAKTYTGGSNEAGFKIIENYSNSTQKWYGNTGTMTRANCSNWTFTEGDNNNCGITADVADTYTFTFDASTKKLSVTYPAQSYTISYNANGGSGAPAAQTKNHDVALTLSSTVPTRTGYTFQNWNTKDDGTGTTYKSGAQYTANAAATLYAQWTANTYTITYKDQGGANFSGTHASGNPTKHTYGTATTLKTATKTGYTFGGWFTNSACTGNAVTSLGATAYTANITLYAKWTVITYTITYNANNGSGAPAAQTKTYGETLTLSSTVPTRTGYTFTGWNTASNGSGTAYASGASYTVNVAATLYAQWTANTYTITYKDQGNVAFSGTHASGYPTTHTYGTATTLKTASKTGYTFGGWFTNSSCTGNAVTSLDATAYTANITLYAKWTVITYTITYNANNGSGAPAAQTKTYGETLTLSSTVPTRTGYTFTGWNTASNGSGTAYASGASYTANAAATLYAQWKADQYTITYDANGGVNPPAAQTKIYGVSLTLTTSKPTRDGYNFTGWNTAANGSGTAYASGGTFTTNAATTLYAQWEEVCYQTATEGTGSYSNGTITLSAKFNTCGSAFIGFQWKEEDNEWCYEDNNTNPCFIPLGQQSKENEIVTKTVTKPSGKSYVFRPYIAVGNDAKNWVYGTAFTVGTCTLPIINSTDASFNKNNFADFAALYVTDCSGKEVTAYQWYKDGNEYVSKCNYTTKDGVVNGDAGKTNNIRPNAAGNYTCKVTYEGGTSATSAAFVVSATSGTTYADFKSNLPVIMVNTGKKDFPSCPAANETASKNAEKMKKKLSVDVKILFDGSIVYDRKARMAYRGSSSLNFQKKSYAFCPGDANCGDKDKGEDYVKTAKLNMLGIGEAADKDWVLYAAAADPSMLRNRMVFETYQAMRPGEWGVKSRYVELIINGEYKGVYLMMDKITQNKKRVNVEWDVKDETKRGFILKFDKTDIPDRSVDYPDGDEKTFLSKYSGKYDITTYDAQVDQAFEIEYPEKGDIEDDGGNWYEVVDFIKGKVNEFETALAAGEYQKVQQIIDYESWADWFILSEYTKNVDAFRASCVFTYDGTKIKATPLWDQELSFNNQSVHANRHTTDPGNKGCQSAIGLLIKNDKVYTDGFAAPFWFTGKLAGGKGTEKLAEKTFAGALLNDPCFVQMVKNRWTAHKSGALSNASLTALITNYEKELTDDVRTREASFWSSNDYSRETLSCSWNSNSTGYYDDDYATAKGHITAWISDNNASTSGTGRRKGLDAAISALEGTGLDISISPASIQTTPWVPVVIQVQNETGYEYTLTYTDGELDKQPNIIIEKSGDTYKYHIPRPWPAGDEQVEGERKDINYGIKATLQIGDANNQCGTSGELPSATATIILQDEENDDCPQP